MLILGILSGLGTALLQSTSYLCSASFMSRYRSSVRLVVFSQLVMGIIGAVTLPFTLSPEVTRALPGMIPWLVLWIMVFSAGQFGFFSALRTIEPSRMSSLLGLKIPVLALMYTATAAVPLGWIRWLAVLLSCISAVGMNWSGGVRFSRRGICWLAVTLVAYALTDLVETRLVTMPAGGSLIRNAFAVGALCYLVLGIATLPLLRRFRFTRRQFVLAVPFAVTWYLSQMLLFVCFGSIGTVFGNVIQASRGVMSVAMGWLLLRRNGPGCGETGISGRMWLRRLAAAILMMLGIALYSLAERL